MPLHGDTLTVLKHRTSTDAVIFQRVHILKFPLEWIMIQFCLQYRDVSEVLVLLSVITHWMCVVSW